MLNETDKQHNKRRRSQLKNLGNSLLSFFSFHKIKTFKDMLEMAGLDTRAYFEHELNEPLTFNRIKEWLDDRRIELEVELWLKENPPKIEHEIQSSTTTGLPEKDSETTTQVVQSIPSSEPVVEEELWPVEKETKTGVTFFWFQHKAGIQILKGFGIEKPIKKL